MAYVTKDPTELTLPDVTFTLPVWDKGKVLLIGLGLLLIWLTTRK